MNDEVIKYVDLVMSMSLDFKMGKIDYKLYTDNLLMIAKQLKEITNNV